MAKKTKQLDIWSDQPQRVINRVNELIDKGAIANDSELEHIWNHRITIPWLTGELSETQFRKRMHTYNVPGLVNQWCSNLFKDAPVKCDFELCDGCGSKLISDVCSCGLVSNDFHISEMTEVVYKSSYRPCQRFRKAFIRVLRSAGYWAAESEFQAVLEAYSLVVNAQTQQEGGGKNLLCIWFVLYKLIELFIDNSFNKELILQKIRLPKDRRRVVAWDRRWRRIVNGLECISYKPTLKAERMGYVGPPSLKKYDTSGLDI